jgi:hypothetical protein
MPGYANDCSADFVISVDRTSELVEFPNDSRPYLANPEQGGLLYD